MGIRVTTGYTATARRNVTLTWKCSHCGADNRDTQKIEGIGQTGLFFGKPTNENYRQEAQQALLEQIKDLCKPVPSERFVDAEFTCKCSACGKREPWAKLRYGYLKTVRGVLLYLFVLPFVVFVAGHQPIPLLLWLGALIWTFCHESPHRKKMYQQIDALPAQSIPRIVMDLNGTPVELRPEIPEPSPEPPIQRAPVTVQLTVKTGPEAGRVIRLEEGSQTVLGRRPDLSDIALREYKSVSGRHCRVEVHADGLRVTDLGSTNGTVVNGHRLTPNQPAAAENGSVILLANPDCTLQVNWS